MGQHAASGLSLFDLLAREWTLESDIVQTDFSQDESVAVFRLSSGRIALAATTDGESPKIRTRMDLETGRTTIRPREKPVPALKVPLVQVHPGLPVVRFGARGFAVVDDSGALQQVTAGGQVVERLKPRDGAVTALCSDAHGAVLALARGDAITVLTTADMTTTQSRSLDHAVSCVAISPQGTTLAAWGQGLLSLVDLREAQRMPQVMECPGDIAEISWNATGTHLSCASEDKSVVIVNRGSGGLQRIEGFPAPVRNTAFCGPDGALVASGAYRLAAWSGTDLPANDRPGTPLSTGKPGFVAISAIAAHPTRPLVASGYASGLVAIASIGSPEEMMLHQERGTDVGAMRWSASGTHLAIGFASGKAAIVTFPEQMF
ncbi:WD40 repeat domain-containing protein, partial [Puniceibacterium confluentis]|uniref:WD40 repeat domain-containing protein n=1 Tax=Puniceibacterium confluentis TaxID=1958944 RepID=UPI0035652936